MTDQSFGLLCWGSGQFGQHGHAVDDPVTILESRIDRFEGKAKFISCGASHTVVATVSNDVFAWGNGQNGQLGCGDTSQHLSPVRMKLRSVDGVKQGESISGVACGDRHTCVLLTDGRVLCCGSNFYAQLSYDHMQPRYREDLLIPTLMPLSQRVIQVACGQYHTVMLYESGEVACIGRNMYGQIGAPPENAKYDCFEKPKILSEVFDHSVTRIAAGSNHSLCIDDHGTAYCWGYGRPCGLRQGHAMTPTKMRCHERKIVSVDGGSTHSALLTEHGQVLMLGSNSDGQCGLGSGVHFLTSPTQIPPEHFRSRRVGELVCGENYTAACTETNQLFLWGKNSNVISSAAIDCRYYEPILIEKSYFIHRLVCGSWHAAALVSELPTTLRQDGAGGSSTEPSLISESSSDCVELGLASDAEAEMVKDAPVERVERARPPEVGLCRERTRITLAELYAPTPTPRFHPPLDISDDESDNGSSIAARSNSIPSPNPPIVEGRDSPRGTHLSVSAVWDPPTNGTDRVPTPEPSPRNAWIIQFPVAPNPDPTSSDASAELSHFVANNPLAKDDPQMCQSLTSDSPSQSVCGKNHSTPSHVTAESIAPFTVAEVTLEPHHQSPEPSTPLGLVRVPSPPNVTKPAAISKVSLKRESLAPLNFNGYSQNRSVSEDLYMLRTGNRVPFRPRQASEDEGHARLKAPLNRRPSDSEIRTSNRTRDPSENPQLTTSTERSFMLPRTLTFVLNDRRELQVDNKLVQNSNVPPANATASTRTGVQRPAAVTRRLAHRGIPTLRRSYTTMGRSGKY